MCIVAVHDTPICAEGPGAPDGYATCTGRGVVDRPDLRIRVRGFALAVLTFTRQIPRTPEHQIFVIQVLKASSAVSANYHAARRSRSRKEFIAKLGSVVEEADESVVWLEFMRDGGIASNPELLAEAKELCAIFTAALQTARTNHRR